MEAKVKEIEREPSFDCLQSAGFSLAKFLEKLIHIIYIFEHLTTFPRAFLGTSLS